MTDQEWETVCELTILLETAGSMITAVTLQLIDPAESVLAEYTYEGVSYELGRPELQGLLESLNQDEDDQGDEDIDGLEEYGEFK